MIISAKLIKSPRKAHDCNRCHSPILSQKLRLFGAAHEEEKPYVIYLHPTCIGWHDDKIKQALERVNYDKQLLAPEKKR